MEHAFAAYVEADRGLGDQPGNASNAKLEDMSDARHDLETVCVACLPSLFAEVRALRAETAHLLGDNDRLAKMYRQAKEDGRQEALMDWMEGQP